MLTLGFCNFINLRKKVLAASEVGDVVDVLEILIVKSVNS